MELAVKRYLIDATPPHDAYGFAEWVTQSTRANLAHDYCTSQGWPWVDEWTDAHWEEAYIDLQGQFELWKDRVK